MSGTNTKFIMDRLGKKELQAIGKKYKTVKAHPAIDYLRHYEYLFREFRDLEFDLLELGAGPLSTIGASFYMWRDFFTRARIVGVDNKQEAEAVSDPDGRIKIEIGDLGEASFLSKLAKAYSPSIIVDDASHKWEHQIGAFEALFPSLAPGGVYVVEDVHTSYGDRRKVYGGSGPDAFSYFSVIANLVCGRTEPHPLLEMTPPTPLQIELANKIDLIIFGRRLVIMYKMLGEPFSLLPPKKI